MNNSLSDHSDFVNLEIPQAARDDLNIVYENGRRGFAKGTDCQHPTNSLAALIWNMAHTAAALDADEKAAS